MIIVQGLPDAEGDEGGAVSGGEVGAAFFYGPAVRLPEFFKSVFSQLSADLLNGVKAAGAFLDKIQHFFCSFLVHE